MLFQFCQKNTLVSDGTAGSKPDIRPKVEDEGLHMAAYT